MTYTINVSQELEIIIHVLLRKQKLCLGTKPETGKGWEKQEAKSI